MADVLVVDDDGDIRSLLELALSLGGHEVTAVPGGAEALAVLAAEGAERHPVVILDVQMPDLDGWEVLGKIRSDPALDAVPVILCTVRAAAADLARGWMAGCDAYVPKPFDLPTLSAQVVRLADLPTAELTALRRERTPTLGR